MGKREKLVDRLTNSPQNATFADIRSLLEYEGFYLDRVTGSHHIFKYAELTFVIPVHDNRVKAIYVRKVLELIDLADTELEEEDEEE
jgi:predicted RNA binding protein YcfA (HicA-like mRNA interferase family)